MSKTISITNGPSKKELFDGLRLFSEKKIKVSFVIKDSEKKFDLPVLGGKLVPRKILKSVIQSIQAEDGSGHSWNISICVEGKDLLNLSLPVDVKIVFGKQKIITLKGYYSTKTKKGHITFE